MYAMTYCSVANSTCEVPDEEALLVSHAAMLAEFGLSRNNKSEVVAVLMMDGSGEVFAGGSRQPTLLI